MTKKLEIACFDLESALLAAQAGAHRLEFCAALHEGGISPLLAEVNQLLEQVNIPVYVMVRARGGHFVYTDEEFDLMKKQLSDFKAAGVHGFVFGCLKNDNHLDLDKNALLLEMAGGLPCTFHRAADHTPDLSLTVNALARMGFKRVLTSGGKGNAPDNVETLAQLVSAFGGQIGILPGGGVRSTNIHTLMGTGAVEFHSSGITAHSNEKADETEIKKLLDAIR